MIPVLKHFDVLTELGLKVIPLKNNSKAPLCKGWTNKWNKDEIRNKLEIFHDSNLGVLLGEVIDVEGDSEQANNIIKDLIKDYPHPTYSSSRSIHHLFISPDYRIRHFEWEKIEFRGYGHQSVLPPSVIGKTCYKWLENAKFPIPEMPEELYNFLKLKIKIKNNGDVKPGHTIINCSKCQNRKFLHKKRLKLELIAFKELGLDWSCNLCRRVDIRPMCRKIRVLCK